MSSTSALEVPRAKLWRRVSVSNGSPVTLTFQKDLQVDLAVATMAVRRVGDIAVVNAFVL